MRAGRPTEIRLTLAPTQRFEAIDVNNLIAAQAGDLLQRHSRAVYCSMHTTAGYVGQSLSARLRHDPQRLGQLVRSFHAVFPQGAGYRHDRMELRAELSADQKATEPPNADSHLTFIGAGLRNCVTYVRTAGVPVYFIDLDGAYKTSRRTRTTAVLVYDDERVVTNTSIPIPVSLHPIASINLGDPRLGLFDWLNERLARGSVERARVDLEIGPCERSVGLTVNEYETLLMQHDLLDVLKDPLRFATSTARRLLENPRAIPGKTLSYAKYDAVQLMNLLTEALGLDRSSLERLVAKAMAVPAKRLLRRRRVSFLAGPGADGGPARIMRGVYQSPILVQWEAAERQSRRLDVTIVQLS